MINNFSSTMNNTPVRSTLGGGAFIVALATSGLAAYPPSFLTARQVSSNVRDVNSSHSALYVNSSHTVQRDFKVRENGRGTFVASRTDTPEHVDDLSHVDVGNWEMRAAMPKKWVEALEELKEYSGLTVGWKGGDSQPVCDQAVIDTDDLINLLAPLLPEGPAPMIGADDSGYIVLTWDEDDVVGTLSIKGNGYYSYYIKRGDETLSSGKELLLAPIPAALIAILA